MNCENSKLILRHKCNIVISEAINTGTHDIVGGVWSDENGKIHFAPLAMINGAKMPDFPSPENVYVRDVKVIGIEKA